MSRKIKNMLLADRTDMLQLKLEIKQLKLKIDNTWKRFQTLSDEWDKFKKENK